MTSDHSAFRMSSRFAVIASLALLCGVVAIAKESTAQVSEETATASESAWTLREERATDFRMHMLQGNALITDAHAKEAELREKRLTDRLECLDIIRRSNKDRLFPETLRCFRKDTEITGEIQDARRKALSAYPNVSKDGASLVNARADLLGDAYDTVLQAIDAGVYETEQELSEARTNLQVKYRVPYAATQPRVAAERTLAWISYLMLGVRTFEEATEDQETLTALGAIQECLSSVESILDASLVSGDHQEIKEALGQQLSPLKSCISLLHNTALTDVTAQES